MTRFAYVLILVSLVAASIAAMTAYVPRLDDLPPDAAQPPTLNAPAGRDPGDADRPLFDPDAAEEPVALTADVIFELREAGVERVRVREFAFSRWSLWWLFAFSAGGLVAGGLIIRRTEKERAAAMVTAASTKEESPAYALEATEEALRELLEELESRAPSGAADGGLKRIMTAVDRLTDTHLPAFVAARPGLVARFGMAGYARIMDRFASGERMIYRAWSTAADGHVDASIDALEQALPAIRDAHALLEEMKGE